MAHSSTASHCERPSRARLFFVLASVLFASSVFIEPTQAQTALRVVGSDRLEVDALPGFAYQLQDTPSLDATPEWASLGEALTSEAPGVLSWPITTTDRESYFRVEISETGGDLTPGQAEARVISEIIRPGERTNLVLGLRWPEPLPAGAVIEPLSPREGNQEPWKAPAPSYLLVIDHSPAQKLAHPFTCVLVEIGTGRMVTNSFLYPPMVDGVSHLTTLADRWAPGARFFPTDFAGAPPLARSLALEFPPLDESLLPSSSLHAAGSGTANSSTAQPAVNCTNTIGKKIAVVIASGADDEIQNDARDMSALLKQLGFQVTDLNSKSNSLGDVIIALQQAGQGLGPCDKFFVYLSSHTQLVDDNNDGKPDRTPLRLDYGLGHTNKSQWAWVPGTPGALPTLLRSNLAGRVNLMMDTCFSAALATLIRARNFQLPPGVEWNLFASSSPTNTSAGAIELDFLLDYGNDDVNSAYTAIILRKVKEAADANTIDQDGDGQLSIDEIEQVFLEAHFAAEDELEDAQKPEFNRFMGAVPVAVSDRFTTPPGVRTVIDVAGNDTVAHGMEFVLVEPPALHPDLFSWNPRTGEASVAGLSTVGQVSFAYRLAGSGWETAPVTVTILFDPRMNHAEEFLSSGPETVRVPSLVLDGLHYPVYQFRLTNNPSDACQEAHWHAHGAVFPLDVPGGPGRVDPNPPSCGFGRFNEVTLEEIEVSKDVWQQFLIDHIPPL